MLADQLGSTDQPKPAVSTTPGGIWSRLAKSAASAQNVPHIWANLQAATAQPVAANKGVFAELQQRADPAQYRPKALPNIPEETVVENGTQTIIHSPTGHYLSLSPLDLAIWHAMDGSRTIGGLALVALSHSGKVFDHNLIDNLRAGGFLEDHPVGIYRQLNAIVAASTAEGWGRRLLRALWGRSFVINDIDRWYGAFYRGIGWLAFTLPARLMIGVIAVMGLLAYAFAAPDVARQIISSESGLTMSVLALYLALLISFVLHESAHALAVKHYDRDVVRGGIMLYFGMPAAFVDTSDMWRSRRWPRIVVSAAGPISDLVVGGCAALVAYFAPQWDFSPAAYRLATMCYVATLFNLNPLLELDGYHILVDYLQIPRLRPKALAFVRWPLWQKLREKQSFSREERIFTVYGLLAVVYTVVATVAAVFFWRRLIEGLWKHGEVGRLIALALLLGVFVPTAVGLLLASLGALRSAALYVHRKGYARRPALLAAAAVALVVLLALGSGSFIPLLAACCWVLGLTGLGALVPDYRGARLLPALYALTGAAALGVAGSLSSWLLPLDQHWLVVCIGGLALLMLLLAAFAVLLDLDVRAARADEFVATALLLAMAFVAGAVALYRAQATLPSEGFWTHLIVASPAYFGALALALLLPYLLAMRGSRLAWGWLLVWIGVLVQTCAYALGLVPESAALMLATVERLDLLAAGLCAGGWLIQLATLRHVAAEDLVWTEQPAISEAQRLQRALRMCYAGCYRQLRAVYGWRRAKALDDRMDILSATANWEVTAERDTVQIGEVLARAPLDVQGSRYAEVLRYTVATIEDLAGANFARRAIRVAYDALPWPEREAAERRCFPDTPWAAELSSTFGSVRDLRLRLLRQVELFAFCDDDELEALVSVVQTRQVPAGQRLLAIGEVPQGMWIVEAGEVSVSNAEGRVVEELRRGAYFGADSAQHQPAEHTYRTTIASALLFIPALDLHAFLARDNSHVADGEQTRKVLRLLERVPLFADFPRHTLRGLAMIARQEGFGEHKVIVREGQPSGMFYLIVEGQAAVIARRNTDGASSTQSLAVVARLGAEEFFGELELLRGTPPVASVVSVTRLTLLALPHDAIATLLSGSSAASRSLQQVGTGRLLDLRQRLMR